MNKLLYAGLLLPLLGCGHNVKEDDKANLNNNALEQIAHHVEKQDPINTTKNTILLDVPLIKQNPELKYGCEVTSLAMMLQYAGQTVTKMELFQKVQKDTDPLIKNPNGDIMKWGNPQHGFVGDMTGRQAGYAVFDEPLLKLANEYLDGRALNLTGQDFEVILSHLADGYPVVVWTTGDFRLPDRWESWKHGKQNIKTPLDLHAVVLTGFDSNYVFLNDPLAGRKNVKVKKAQFLSSWEALKKRAISYENLD